MSIDMSIDDPLNAFCRHDEVALEGSATGPLLGCTFAVKDVFDIAGHRTGNGNPLWLETHPPANALRRQSSACSPPEPAWSARLIAMN